MTVDSTPHDTTSIVKTIEERYGLAPLSSRDAKVASLASALPTHGRGKGHGPTHGKKATKHGKRHGHGRR